MRKLGIYILMFVLLTARVFSAVISTIAQLDDAALFSFSLQSDNKGYDRTHAPEAGGVRSQRMEDWIKANDEFCIGVGDHIFPNRDRWINQMENDPFFHNHYYPVLGDHDNETKYFYGVTGTQDQWGRGWVIFKALNNFFNRPDVQFRPKQSTKINNNGKLVDDQLVDYYAVREHSGFKVHIIATHYGDASVFAERTRAWMMQKISALGAVKTDRDIIVVLVHCSGNFFSNVTAPGSVEDGYSAMSKSDMDKLMMTADLICDASDHVFRRHNERDGMYDGTEALWINTGALDTGACGGYVNIHVLDNPPRFTMQYIDVETKSSRMLHVGNSLKIDADNPYIPYRYAYMKYINGPIQKIDWNNFPLAAPTNNAAFVSQSVPATMVAGTTSNVTVRMKNTGTITWRQADGHKLGSQNTENNTRWGRSRVELPSGTSVFAGQEYSFVFPVTAPTTIGTYNFQWRMVDDVAPYQGAFGAWSANLKVSVVAAPANKAPYFTANPFSMPNATAGTAYSQSISSKAVDPEGGTKIFSKVAGPTWLSVTSSGTVQGTPGSSDVGTNSFSVKVADSAGLSATATMKIIVVAAQPSLPPVGSIITLKAVNGKYVSATYSTNNALIANKTTVSNYERFKVVKASSGIALQCMGNSKYVSINVPDGSKPMVANRSSIGSYEDLKLIQSGSAIAFQSVLSSRYASAVNSGADPLQAIQTRIGSFEEFTWKVE